VLIIGLTGGIGTGKTEVIHVLRELGAMVIEADKVAHLSYEPGTQAHREIVDKFGGDVLADSGVIDRSQLGKIVFSNGAYREELEAIVWPAVDKLIEASLSKEEKRGTKIVVIEAAKLFEPGWDRFTNVVWTVEAPEEAVVARVAKRSGLSETDTKARIAAQSTREERVARADIVIENNTTLEDLRTQISKIWESIPK
jgi:dephospho-CoA kinase